MLFRDRNENISANKSTIVRLILTIYNLFHDVKNSGNFQNYTEN